MFDKMSYRILGAHPTNMGKTWRFAVYAPRAKAVSVVGDFNGWNGYSNPMHRGDDGTWFAEIGPLDEGALYKYAITSRNGNTVLKADPYAFSSQLRPDTASVLCNIDNFYWNDYEYFKSRSGINPFTSPINIYEVHLPSWKKSNNISKDMHELISYAKDMAYTHIELLPVSEFPLDDSWGYQSTGYFSVSARFGGVKQLMNFINLAHINGLGVIIDWVPAHFAKDEHGLRCFDGEPLFESSDSLRAEMPLWGTLLFDFERPEVKYFLIQSALFILKELHADGLRVDAVSCMLYHNFCKDEWRPNKYGGSENLAAIDFIKELNTIVHSECPGCLMIAEESSAYPLVTAPVHDGGLGFDFKWNMGFMNDTLTYFEEDSFFRRYHHDKLTFPLTYAFSENFILPFSHDEVVCGKHSLIERMHGSYEQMFEQLRLLLFYQMASVGKKLNFMGNDIAQFIEWDFKRPIDWFLLDYPQHKSFHEFVRELNRFYLNSPALHNEQRAWDGFRWLSVDDSTNSVIAFMRTPLKGESLIAVMNFTPMIHEKYSLCFENLSGKIPKLQYAFSTHSDRKGNLKVHKDKNGNYRVYVPLHGYEGVFLSIK